MKKNYFLTLLAALLVFAQSCKKTTPNNPTNPTTNIYALSVTGGTYPNQTTYMFGTTVFPTGSVGTSSALESASSAIVFRYGKNLYQNNFGAPAMLHKFEFDATTGKAKETGSFAVAGFKTIGSVDFISETEAYATVASYKVTPKLVRFNPTTMAIISTIDLSSIQRADAGEVYYEGLVHRDNYLYMGVNYLNKAGDNLEDKVFVTVIDRTTGTVVKQISDTRSSEMWNGGSESSYQANCMIKDSNNDIYVMGYANNGKPSGVLKIKSGTTDFDASYFFNLNTVTGNPCLGLLYFGSGQVFTIRYSDPVAYPFDLDANYNSVAKCQYYKIDLTAKTTSGNISTAIPLFYGVNAFATQFDSSKIYFNAPGAATNSIYSYQTSNGTVKKEFDLASGACRGFAKIY